jgi:trehalose 6-phosphate phosphatase
VISGRRRADVRCRVSVQGVRCQGLYGWEDGVNGALSETVVSLLAQARGALAARLQPVSGVWVEDKGAAFVLHFRGAAEASVRRARAILNRELEPFAAGLHVIDEDCAWAVLPRQLEGKGQAVRQQWHAFHPGALPVYAGDGESDEPAFAALARGVTVCVGPRRKTRARFHLQDPAEVRSFLEKLEVEVR